MLVQGQGRVELGSSILQHSTIHGHRQLCATAGRMVAPGSGREIFGKV